MPSKYLVVHCWNNPELQFSAENIKLINFLETNAIPNNSQIYQKELFIIINAPFVTYRSVYVENIKDICRFWRESRPDGIIHAVCSHLPESPPPVLTAELAIFDTFTIYTAADQKEHYIQLMKIWKIHAEILLSEDAKNQVKHNSHSK